MQPLLKSMYGAALIFRAAADLNLAPTGFGIERQEGAFLNDLDPAAGLGCVVLVHVEADDF